jgi:hypothetical protein
VATLTFATLQTEVFDQSGLDSTDANNQTRVQRWINMVQQDICARWPWNFLRSRENIITVVDKTSGTISVSSGGTAVTGVSTAFATGSTWLSGASYGDIGNFIQFSGANDWYPITAVSSATSLTIGNPYQGAVNLSGAMYTIRKFYYSLSSSCDRICDVKNWNTPLKLDELFPRDVDLVDPNPQSTNTSYGFIPYGYDPLNNVQIIPYPYPSDARLFEIKTFKRPTDMSSGSDLPTVPNKWAHIITFGANALSFAYLRKFDQSEAWDAKFEKKIVDMKRQERTSEDLSPVLQSIDAGNRTENWLQMPGQYPQVPGRP